MYKEKIIIGSGVAKGMEYHELDHLPKRLRNRLINMMSRISEMSFRRGYQHGKECRMIADPVEFRFRTNKDKSPFADAIDKKGRWARNSGYTAKVRLLMEYPILSELFQV